MEWIIHSIFVLELSILFVHPLIGSSFILESI